MIGSKRKKKQRPWLSSFDHIHFFPNSFYEIVRRRAAKGDLLACTPLFDAGKSESVLKDDGRFKCWTLQDLSFGISNAFDSVGKKLRMRPSNPCDDRIMRRSNLHMTSDFALLTHSHLKEEELFVSFSV